MKTPAISQLKTEINPLSTHKERLLAWGKIRGIWKHRLPEPIRELKKIRREWERK